MGGVLRYCSRVNYSRGRVGLRVGNFIELVRRAHVAGFGLSSWEADGSKCLLGCNKQRRFGCRPPFIDTRQRLISRLVNLKWTDDPIVW